MEYKRTKRTKKRQGIKNNKNSFYFSIYTHLKTKSPAHICRELSISHQKLNYYLQALRRQGMVKKVGYGTWEVVKELKKDKVQRTKKHKVGSLLDKPNLVKENVRGHAFVFRVKLPKIRNWNRREEYLKKKKISFKSINRGTGQSILFRGRKVHLNNNSIIIYERSSFIEDTAEGSKSYAIYEMERLVKGIENLLKASFQIRKQYQFKICREHYSLMKNCMAIQYNLEGKKLQVYNHKGLWMLIDNSYNLNELETVKSGEAVKDNEGVQKYFNEHKELNWEVTPRFLLEMMNGIQQNQILFSQNIETHIKAIQELGSGVQRMTKLLDRLNGGTK